MIEHLRSPAGASLRLQLRLAREFQVPHSTLIRDWSAKDLALHVADLLVRDDIGECGQPHAVSTQPGASDRYQVVAATVCGACAVLAEHRKAHPEPPPGQMLRVIDITAAEGADAEGTAFGPVFE